MRPGRGPNRSVRRRWPRAHAVVVAAAGLLSPAGVAAADDAAEPVDAPPIEVPIAVAATVDVPPVIDGRLDDPAWSKAEPAGGFRQVVPRAGAPATQATEIRLVHDRDMLYVAIRCFDDDPDRIVATQLRRDAGLGADDRVAIVIDPFFDRRNGYYFELNPIGARGDGLIEDNEDLRRDWDGIWYGKARVDDEGWTAEFGIPFRTISFNSRTDRWSLNVTRTVRRTNETTRWASPTPDRLFNSVADAGYLDGMTGLRQGAGIDVKPYATASYRRNSEDSTDDVDLDAGLDVFWKITPELTFALTLNTDFAETEVDDRQVNLTRFPLFFPEKRDFFLQDAGIFDFGGINRNPLPFFSRRIGLGPDGAPRDILAGAKLTGRVEDLNLGVLNVQMKEDDTLGNKNFTVVRPQVNVGERSTLGAIATYGDPNEPGDAWTVGADWNFRTDEIVEDRIVDGHVWAQRAGGDGRGAAGAYGGKLGYPNDRVNWEIGFTQIDDDFENELGFVPRNGIREYFARWRYRWRPKSGSLNGIVRRIDTQIDTFYVTNLEDDVESGRLAYRPFSVEFESGELMFLNLTREREVLERPFEISDGVVIPVGDYRFDRWNIGFFTSSKRPVSARLEVLGGEFYEGDRLTWEASVDWRVSANLFLSAELELNDVDLPQGDFITRLIRGRVNVAFSPDVTWTNFIQFDNVSDSLGVNSRVQWIVEPGNEVYLVLNQSLDRDDDSFRVTRTDFTTKVGWTFRF